MEAFKVKVETGAHGSPELIRASTSPLEIPVEVGQLSLFGFDIHNQSKNPVYIALFKFDCSGLSISAYNSLSDYSLSYLLV